MPPQRRRSIHSHRCGGSSCQTETELFRCCVSQSLTTPSLIDKTYKASRDCCRPVPTMRTSQAVLSRVSIVSAQKKTRCDAEPARASSNFSATADVTASRTKSADPLHLLSFFIAHAKDLGLSTPCPQCVRPFIGAERCAKEGIRPVSTALDFT